MDIKNYIKLKHTILRHIDNLYSCSDDLLDDFQLGIIFGLKTALITIEIFEEDINREEKKENGE